MEKCYNYIRYIKVGSGSFARKKIIDQDPAGQKSPIPTPQPCIIKLTIHVHVHQMNFQSSYIPNTVQFVWDETCKIQSDDQTNILIKPLQDQTRWVWITSLKCVHEALSNHKLTIYKWTRLIEHTEQARSSKAEW